MSQGGIHSTGRGGAGNIGPDSSVYVDGEIVREGHGAPTSTGRGGTGNIARSAPGTPQQNPVIPSEEVVPESATRTPGESYDNYHTGRGGEGNVHKEKYGGHSHAPKEHKEGEGFVEKVKHAVGLNHGHKKEKTPEPGAK